MRRVGGPTELAPGSDTCHLRVLMDHSCIEVFTGTGEVLSTRIYRCAVAEQAPPASCAFNTLCVCSCCAVVSTAMAAQQASLTRIPYLLTNLTVTQTGICLCRGHPPEDAVSGISFISFGGTARIAAADAWDMVRLKLGQNAFKAPHSSTSIFADKSSQASRLNQAPDGSISY